MKNSCRYLFSISLLVVTSLFVGIVSAAALSLTQIGALSTQGRTYTEWWYSGTNPVLAGTAGENATVTIKIDDSTYSATADASGNWSYATTLPQSDPVITLTSGSETYSFTLHVGQMMDSTTTTTTTGTTEETTSSVPSTGFPQAMGLILGTSMVMLGLQIYNKNKKQGKEAYAESVLDSLK